jgi:hypothetical protein
VTIHVTIHDVLRVGAVVDEASAEKESVGRDSVKRIVKGYRSRYRARV